jgi:hypothetical protein
MESLEGQKLVGRSLKIIEKKQKIKAWMKKDDKLSQII